jgi:hypothetical protein
MGLDSVQAVKLVQSLEDTLRVKLDSTVVWECSNIEELAARIGAPQAAASREGTPVSSVAPGLITRSSRSTEEVLQLSEEEATAALLEEITR